MKQLNINLGSMDGAIEAQLNAQGWTDMKNKKHEKIRKSMNMVVKDIEKTMEEL